MNGLAMAAQQTAMSSLLVASSVSQHAFARFASFGPVLSCLLIVAALMFVVEGCLILAWMLENEWCARQFVFLL